MAKTGSCILTPEVNGEPSELYKDLSKMISFSRPLVNYIYALYLQPGVAADIDAKLTANNPNQTPRHNAQGQHYAEDVLNYFRFDQMQNEFGSSSVELGRLRQQITDPSNALQVMQLADTFNDTHKGLVAYVVKSGSQYQIYVKRRDSIQQKHIGLIKDHLNAWRTCCNAFQQVGIDLNNVPAEIKDRVTPYTSGLISYLISLRATGHNNLYKKDAWVLFELGLDSNWRQILENMFGSIQAAAQAVDNLNHGGLVAAGITSHQASRLRNAIDNAKQFLGLDLQDLKNQVDQTIHQSQQSNFSYSVEQTLDQLRSKYNIDASEEVLTSKKVSKLSEAASHAIMITQRRIRDLHRQAGYTQQVKSLMDLQTRLFSELRSRRYYKGVVDFLQQMSPIISNIENMIQSTPQNGTPLENAFAMAKTLESIRIIYDEYHPVLDALSNTELDIDQAISQTDLDALRSVAQNLNKILDEKYMVLQNMAEQVMLQLVVGIVGDKTADGKVVSDIISMPNQDVSIWDNTIYSMARCSNLIVAAAGDITQRAQVARNERLNNIALRIRKATDALYKSRIKNTEFMYEQDGMGHWVIISDIDWQAYQHARNIEKARLRKLNLEPYEFLRQLQDWDEANTEDRVVDRSSGRTERVPNSKYRKNNGLVWNNTLNMMEFRNTDYSTAEQEYYDTMMQIKGEMGSLVPDVAQHHYRPPQLRRNMLDAMTHARSLRDYLDAIKHKAERWSKIMEDDTDFYKNGTLVNGQFYANVASDERGQVKKYIPIFFVNQIDSDAQGELLKDFSSGIQAFAATAINYDCMNDVLDVVNFMRDYVDSKKGSAMVHNEADIVSDGISQVVEILRKPHADTVHLMDSFINQHFYGQNINPNQALYKYAKQIKNIIGYTSFKGLSTNWLGAASNFLVAEFQMLIEAGAGEFYNYGDYVWANAALFGKNGVGGDIAELFTNNMHHKAPLLAQLFDPLQENFSNKMHNRYHYSIFRKILQHDCSMIGYGVGEHFVHYVNMYAVLHHHKVNVTDANGNTRKTTLYHAFEVTDKENGNSELKLVEGTITDANTGELVDTAYLERVKREVKYVNQTTHGSMNPEDKGCIHQHLLGRAIMNFRQWMVEHYSRRFRKRHWDGILQEFREGYWVSAWKMYEKQYKICKTWKEKRQLEAIGRAMLVAVEFAKDLVWFSSRAKVEWNNMEPDQKYNVKRALTEARWFIGLLMLSFALGGPSDHKDENWRRFWIYQVRRLLLDEKTSIPGPWMVNSFVDIMQSPIAAVNTIQAWLYLIDGIGDIDETLKSGPHKGENKYWRNVKKFALPGFKHFEQFETFGKNDGIFKVFEPSPSDY